MQIFLTQSSQRHFKQFPDKFHDAGRLGLARAGDVQRPNTVLLEEFGNNRLYRLK